MNEHNCLYKKVLEEIKTELVLDYKKLKKLGLNKDKQNVIADQLFIIKSIQDKANTLITSTRDCNA